MSLVAQTPPASSGGVKSRAQSGGALGESRKSSRNNTASSHRQSRVSFPATQSALSLRTNEDDGIDMTGGKNPFIMPVDTDVFLMRDRERQKEKHEKAKLKTLKVHEKLTYAAKVGTKAAAKRREAMQALKEQADQVGKKSFGNWALFPFPHACENVQLNFDYKDRLLLLMFRKHF